MNSTMKKINHLLLKGAIVCPGDAGSKRSGAAGVTSAIKPHYGHDILLEPDATMLQHAEANNARLLGVFPKGFALDATHRPHITMIQCFVRTADLDQVHAAAHKVLAARQRERDEIGSLQILLRSSCAIGLAGIVAKPTPEAQLQEDIVAAVAPFTVKTGTIAAFTAPHDDLAMDAALIEYVSTFVPKHTGEHFSPHVTTGVAPGNTSTRCWPTV